MKECYFADYTVGADAYGSIERVCAPLGRRAVIIGGETALEKSAEKLKAAMRNFEIIDIAVYGKECYRANISRLYDKYKDSGADFVVGAGGGKAIDTAKCLADMLGVEVVTAPTIASTCAASSALAVIYDESHVYEGFWYLKRPAFHCFIDTDIIINAPDMYFRAGIGDTLAKYYEVEFSMRGRALTYRDEMGLSIARMCNTPLIAGAAGALADCKKGAISERFETAALIILISTGMVSMLIDGKYNGAAAHAFFYGLTVLPGFEEKFLHGDVVGYCVMVQLMLDAKPNEAKKIGDLLRAMGVETTLAERGIEVSRENLDRVFDATLKDPDMEVVPYEITKDMLFDAVKAVEEMYE
ncbi:MAG: iron-containing alcohol dehydrogenase family protein [Firmicutes bacterium]|nr:iron-containing alcohol dehydrogenase family protein [Bacillota bacterium]